MATASVTTAFTTATTISSSQMNTNFADLVSFLNTNVLHLDGSKTMTGDLNMGANDLTNVATGTFSGLLRSNFDGALVWRDIVQSIPDVTATTIAWESEVYDDGGYWAAGSPTIFTAPRAGYYAAWATVGYVAYAGFVYAAASIVEGASTVWTQAGLFAPAHASYDPLISLFHVDYLAAGGTLKVNTFQHSGGARDTRNGVVESMHFGIAYLGD